MKQLFVNDITVDVVKETVVKETVVKQTVVKDKINAPVPREDKDDAFYIGDLGDIVRKYKLWKSELPRVEPYYAVKCNDDPAVLAVLNTLGTGFDCASKGEIQRILEMGVDPERIIYANPCKQSSHIKFAAKNKIQTMAFDNENELHKIKNLYPTARCVLRILPPEDTKAQCQLGMKYGCHPNHARHLLQVAKQLNLNVIGVSFHVGSGCWDATAFSLAVESSRKVFDIGVEEGFQFELLDIGGGFPGQKTAKITFKQICGLLRPALDTHFPQNSGVCIISEPGRFFVASAFTLAVNVIAKRAVPRDAKQATDKGYTSDFATADDEPHLMYYVNDGVYGSFNCLLYDHAEVFPTVLKDGNKNSVGYTSSIWGPTCDGLDCIMEKTMLPELNIGDWIIFLDMGAYTMSAASSFNGFPKPSCYYTSSEANWQQLHSNRPGGKLSINKDPNVPATTDVKRLMPLVPLASYSDVTAPDLLTPPEI